jgi:hypothetical protein
VVVGDVVVLEDVVVVVELVVVLVEGTVVVVGAVLVDELVEVLVDELVEVLVDELVDVLVVDVVVEEEVEVEQYWYCDGPVQYWYPYAAEAGRPLTVAYPMLPRAASASATRNPASVLR